jgi:hypothetical protein
MDTSQILTSPSSIRWSRAERQVQQRGRGGASRLALVCCKHWLGCRSLDTLLLALQEFTNVWVRFPCEKHLDFLLVEQTRLK